MHLSETLVRHRHVPVSLSVHSVAATISASARQLPVPFGPQLLRSSFGHLHRHLCAAQFALRDPRVNLRRNFKNASPNVCAFGIQRLRVTLLHTLFPTPRNNTRATGAGHYAPGLRSNAADSAIRAIQVVHCKADFGRIIPSIVNLLNNEGPMVAVRAGASARRQASIPPSFHAHASSPQHPARIRMEIVA
jgi:hypothetical protein